MSNKERAKEFLECLGNGKGRVTEEDENPEMYVADADKGEWGDPNGM